MKSKFFIFLILSACIIGLEGCGRGQEVVSSNSVTPSSVSNQSVLSKLELLKGEFVKVEFNGNDPVVTCRFKNKSSYDIDTFTMSIFISPINNTKSGTSCTTIRDRVGTVEPEDEVTMVCEIGSFSRGEMSEIEWNKIV